LTLTTFAFHLSILSEVWLLNFLRLQIISYIISYIHITIYILYYVITYIHRLSLSLYIYRHHDTSWICLSGTPQKVEDIQIFPIKSPVVGDFPLGK
jgi:hypothetical protein